MEEMCTHPSLLYAQNVERDKCIYKNMNIKLTQNDLNHFFFPLENQVFPRTHKVSQ
jgi:hypothetical protein